MEDIPSMKSEQWNLLSYKLLQISGLGAERCYIKNIPFGHVRAALPYFRQVSGHDLRSLRSNADSHIFQIRFLFRGSKYPVILFEKYKHFSMSVCVSFAAILEPRLSIYS